MKNIEGKDEGMLEKAQLNISLHNIWLPISPNYHYMDGK